MLNVRHRPTMEEAIEQRLAHFVSVADQMSPPWGLVKGKDLTLPPVGSGLSTSVKLRGKLGAGIAGAVTISYRSPANLMDKASHDDSLIVDFDSSRVRWRQLIDEGLPGYVRAMGAYICRLERWDDMPETWEISSELCRRLGKDLDGRDGFFRFGPVSYMDRELCRRGCNGMTPEQIIDRLDSLLPEVKLLDDGVLIVAADDFPEQAEIVATDLVIRERLGLPRWT